jgi:glycosyltransferase involved in cell wall biosynthesis
LAELGRQLAGPAAPAEIIVVDDASGPETRAALEALPEPFRILRNETNLGFAASVNRAVRQATAPVVVLLNSDLELPDGWLEPMLEALAAHPETFCVGNVQTAVSDGRIDHAGIVFLANGHPMHQREKAGAGEAAATTIEFPAATAACWVFRRDVFLALGGLDERFRNGFEDIDLCLRARTLGWKTLVASRSVIRHHVASSPGRHAREDANRHHFLQRWAPLCAQWSRDWDERLVSARLAHRPARSPSAAGAIGDVRPPGPVRVLVDLARLVPGGGNGGVKRLVCALLQEVRRVARGRFEFQLLLPESLAAEAHEFRGTDDTVLLLGSLGSEADSPAASGCVRIGAPDANLARSWQSDLLFVPLGVSDFACPDIPVVSLVVDTLHRDHPECLSNRDVAIREVWLDRLAAWSHSIVCISDWVAGQMRRHYPLSADRLRVVRAAVGRMKPPKIADDPVKRDVLLYPANAWPHKNHDTLLVAYRTYLRHAGASAWSLVLTGARDEAMERIEHRAAALGLGERVRCCGYLDDEAFARVWAATGAMVFPSIYEGFGIPVLEAMQAGIPVVAGDVGSIREVVGEACLYADVRDPVALAEAMLRIQTDEALRERLIHEGRTRAAGFDFGKEAVRLAEVFDRAVSDFRTRGTTWRWSAP